MVSDWKSLLFRRPRYLVMIVAVMLVAALAALKTMPRQEDPELTNRYAMIHTPFPGADVERVESLVTIPMERALAEIEEIDEILSRIRPGMSTLSVALDDRVRGKRHADEVWMRVQARMQAAEAELPAGLRSRLQRFSTAAESMLIGITWDHDSPPRPEILRRLMIDLQEQLSARVQPRSSTLFGVPDEEVQVRVDPQALWAVNLGVGDVAAAIAARDVRQPAGNLHGGSLDLAVALGRTLANIDDLGETLLRSGPDGEAVRVADVAEVASGVRTPFDQLALIDGRPGMVLALQTPERVRVDLWNRQVRELLDDYQEQLPQGIDAQVIFDQSVYTRDRLQSLVGSLLLGLLLVISVVVVVMGWRTALLVATTLPLTLGASLAVMNAFGVPINQISVSGLIIALGMLIDNAIIMVDGFGRRRREGLAPAAAIEGSISELGVPLLASTTTTVLAFMPLVLMPGNAGEFISGLGHAVVITLTLSLLIAMTMVLAFAGFLDRSQEGGDRSRRGTSGWSGIDVPRLQRRYQSLLERALLRPWVSLLLMLAVPLAGFAAATQLVGQFFPATDRDQFEIRVQLAPGVGVERARALVERIEARLDEEPDIVASHWFVGDQPPRVYYNTTVRSEGLHNVAWGFVTARSEAVVQRRLPDLQRELAASFPEAAIMVQPFMQGPAVGAPLTLRVVGPDLDRLQQLGEAVRGLLLETSGVTHAEAFVSAGPGRLRVDPDLDAIAAAGLDAETVARELRWTLDGRAGGLILEGSEVVPVVTRLPEEQRRDPASLRERMLTIPGEGGALSVPLGALARVTLEPVPSGIFRKDGERVNFVQAYLQPYRMASPALAEFRQRLADSDVLLPPGYRLEIGGEAEGSSDAQDRLLGVFAPLLVAMVAVLVLAFNSFLVPLLIWAVALGSIGWALLTLWLFGQPLGFTAVIGCMGVIGIAINDSVVVLNGIRGDPAAARGEAAALLRISMLETRHILSTTVTTIGGFTPLIFWGGNLWPPLALALAGGLVGGALLSLLMVPAAWMLLLRWFPERRSEAAALR